jgi:hypothetical protein
VGLRTYVFNGSSWVETTPTYAAELGTYVTSVSGTAPITTSGTTAVTVSIDQTTITANSATNASVLRAYVKNDTGTTLTKGQVVYISGSDGANALISLSTASTEVGSSKTLGILAQTLTTGSQGYVIENGLLVDIDTSAATAGQSIWLGNTPGSFVFGSPPAEPSHSVYLGVVTRVQQNNGEILVKVQNGYEIDELHDVSAASPSDGDIIQYKNTSGLWTKQSISQAGIAASSHTHAYANTVHTHATSDVTTGNYLATLTAGTGVTVTGGTGNAATPTVAIGQAVATNSNVTFNQITASDYIKLSSWNQATAGNDSSSDTVTVTTAGTYYAIGGANCEVSFTPDFVGQQFFVTMTGYCSLNTTTIQYAFVRVTITDSSNTLVETLGYGRADNFGTSGRGSTVAFNQIWTSDTTSARKIKLYGTVQTTNGLVLTLSYWQLNVMALA